MSGAKPMLQALIARGRQLLQDEKQRMNLLLVAGLAGMLLLACSEWLPEKTAAARETPSRDTAAAQPDAGDYTAALERRLEAILTKVEGAGTTRVMVTAACGEETVYATDTERTAESEKTQHVLLGGGTGALTQAVRAPQLLGVAVVCEGGADPGVQSRITEIVRALTDLGSNHITVTKMTAYS